MRPFVGSCVRVEFSSLWAAVMLPVHINALYITKVYSDRNNIQVELIRLRKNIDFIAYFNTSCWQQFMKLSNRRAIGEHTSTAVNCIPPAEVALNLAFGDFERNGDIYGHWGRDEGVE